MRRLAKFEEDFLQISLPSHNGPMLPAYIRPATAFVWGCKLLGAVSLDNTSILYTGQNATTIGYFDPYRDEYYQCIDTQSTAGFRMVHAGFICQIIYGI